MKLNLGVGVVFVASCALFALGACSDDTNTSSTGNSSTSSSSSSSSGASSSSSSSGSSGMSSSSSGSSGMSSSSSSGSGVYTTCSECTNNTTGAYGNQCKTQAAACVADAKCQELATCSYDKCTTDSAGGCCTFQCIKDLATPQASQNLFFALDNCVFCTTCKTLCDPGATDYCKVTAAMGAGCAP